MSRIDVSPARQATDPPSVQAFRALVEAVDRNDVRAVIQTQRELRRLGYAVRQCATRHRPPDRGDASRLRS